VVLACTAALHPVDLGPWITPGAAGMPRRNAKPPPDRDPGLVAATYRRPANGEPPRAAYWSRRAVVPLDGPLGLTVQVCRCREADCPRRRDSLRSELEGRFALPQHESGPDFIAPAGPLRHADHRGIPEIDSKLRRCGADVRARHRQSPGPRRRTACSVLLGRRSAAADHRRGRPGG
jgi:hypothetical protein